LEIKNRVTYNKKSANFEMRKLTTGLIVTSNLSCISVVIY